MTLVKFNPAKSNGSLIPGFNGIFESVFNDTFFNDRPPLTVPAVNISETPEAYSIELAVPGLEKQDFKIALDQRTLSISTEKQEEKTTEHKNFSRKEFSYRNFTRSFTLPETADEHKITARYENGVLQLLLPKKEEAKAVTRQINVG